MEARGGVFDRPKVQRRALLLTPTQVNGPWDLAVRRLQEALRDLSFTVDIGVFGQEPAGRYDWCVLSNVAEIWHAFVSRKVALAQMRQLRQACSVLSTVAMEHAGSATFRKLIQDCQSIGVQSVLDLGLLNQRDLLPRRLQALYRYLPDGLTTSELHGLDESSRTDELRTIPWAVAGRCTPDRVALVDYLVREVDPSGFVYLPRSPRLEAGSAHLSHGQLAAVLRCTRYHIWCSQPPGPYIESDRIRMALLNGAVPVKVVAQTIPPVAAGPFACVMLGEQELGKQLRSFVFQEVRQRFREEFRRIPPLEDGLAEFLVKAGVIDRSETSPPVVAAHPIAKSA